MSKEVIIKYKIAKSANMKIFGKNFVKTNKNICRIIINGKDMELTETYNTNTEQFKENHNIYIKQRY